MNNPTCAQCDCVAGCQANPKVCPNLRVGDLVPATQPKQQQSMEFKDAAYFYNLAMHALSDVGAAHGGCKHRLVHICEELETLMIKNAAQPVQPKATK